MPLTYYNPSTEFLGKLSISNPIKPYDEVRDSSSCNDHHRGTNQLIPALPPHGELLTHDSLLILVARHLHHSLVLLIVELDPHRLNLCHIQFDERFQYHIVCLLIRIHYFHLLVRRGFDRLEGPVVVVEDVDDLLSDVEGGNFHSLGALLRKSLLRVLRLLIYHIKLSSPLLLPRQVNGVRLLDLLLHRGDVRLEHFHLSLEKSGRIENVRLLFGREGGLRFSFRPALVGCGVAVG
mmetsp:Transcript_56084/g.119266  ORF Transcript_56084/g.119266 Transcript_56084/m.119266 type:complete len:236 (-) Transcript_56084:253-960(-)